MYSETLVLRPDGSYAYTFQFDVGSEEASGRWEVRDAILTLSPEKETKVTKSSPTRFKILTIAHKPALSALGDQFEAQSEDSALRLFNRNENLANQPPLQTPTSGTPAAGAPVAPPSGAAGR
jgi:hypothetical protein